MHFLKQRKRRDAAKAADKSTLQKFNKLQGRHGRRNLGIRVHCNATKRRRKNVGREDVTHGTFALVGDVGSFGRSLTPAETVETSYGVGSGHALARAAGTSDNLEAVHRSVLMVAAAFMYAQMMLLGRILLLCDREAPLFVIFHTMFDETTHTLVLETESKHSDRVEALLCLVEVVISFGTGRTHWFEFIVPPMAVPSTSSSSLWDALHLNAFSRVWPHFKTEMAKRVKLLLCDLYEMDDASGNRKYLAHLHNLAVQLGIGLEAFNCCNHIEALIERSLVILNGNDLQKYWEKGASLIRTSGVFGRMIEACNEWLRGFSYTSLVQTVEAKQFACEVMDYCLSKYTGACDKADHMQSLPVTKRYLLLGAIPPGNIGKGYTALFRSALVCMEYFPSDWWLPSITVLL